MLDSSLNVMMAFVTTFLQRSPKLNSVNDTEEEDRITMRLVKADASTCFLLLAFGQPNTQTNRLNRFHTVFHVPSSWSKQWKANFAFKSMEQIVTLFC